MKITKTNFSRFIVLILCLSLLAGCSKKDEESTVTPEPTATSEPVKNEPNVDDTVQGSEAAPTENTDVSTETENTSSAKDNLNIIKKIMPWYLGDTQTVEDKPVYFIDEYDGVPYIDMELGTQLLNVFCAAPGKNHYQLGYEADGETCSYIRENGHYMKLDCEKDTIYFSDYDMFIKRQDDANLVDMLRMNTVDAEGNPSLFKRLDGSYERYGKYLTFDLGAYNIHLLHHEDKYLMPLQTYTDLLLSPMNVFALYNGSSIIITSYISALPNSDLGEIYYQEPTTRSDSLIAFNYNELCFFLDNFYGLKEQHHITSFADFFSETGLLIDLVSEDGAVSNKAVAELVLKYITDKHSNFTISSYYAGKNAFTDYANTYGQSFQDHINTDKYYVGVRDEYYPDGYVGYEEVGNTAFITFDSFCVNATRDYYANPGTSAEVNDTIALVQYAHSQIMRENSPIENVVIDLSCNGGGTFDAALYISGWCLGDTRVNVMNTMTGAEVSNLYRVDVNLDREFDDNDTLIGKNIFCLTSPVSFSCGNLVPALFKNSGKVTLIGKKSGGGSCTVYSGTDADGSAFNISGPYRLSVLWNGAYYDVDQGVVPDVYIAKTENMYNRAALSDIVNAIK